MYVNRSTNDISIHLNQNFYWNPQLNVKYALMDEQRSPTVFMNKITTCAINLILFQLVLSIIRLLNNEKIVLIHAKKNGSKQQHTIQLNSNYNKSSLAALCLCCAFGKIPTLLWRHNTYYSNDWHKPKTMLIGVVNFCFSSIWTISHSFNRNYKKNTNNYAIEMALKCKTKTLLPLEGKLEFWFERIWQTVHGDRFFFCLLSLWIPY